VAPVTHTSKAPDPVTRATWRAVEGLGHRPKYAAKVPKATSSPAAKANRVVSVTVVLVVVLVGDGGGLGVVSKVTVSRPCSSAYPVTAAC